MKHSNKYYEIVLFILFVLSMLFKPVFCPLLFGSLLIFKMLHYVIFLNNLNKEGKEIIGKILSYQRDNEGYKTPFIEFELDGKSIKEKPYFYVSSDISKISSYDQYINKSVAIIYLPNDPSKFIIKTEKGLNYFITLLSMIFACVLIYVTFAQLFGFIKVSGLE